MSRRRRAVRSSRQGGPYIRPSALPALPLAHESVRRFFPVVSRVQRLPKRALHPTLRFPAKRVSRKSVNYRALGALTIRVPERAAFCVRRKVRRQVMFALGVGGSRGMMRGKRFRRTQDSQYRC